MSFEPSVRSLCLLLLFGASALGCGHKAPPIPPPLENPARTADLAVQQRGLAAILSFTYPQTTVSGGVLQGLERVEIWRTKKAMAAFFGEDPAFETEDEESVPATETSEATLETAHSEDAAEPESDPESESEDQVEDEKTASEDDAEPESDVPGQPLEVLAATTPAEFLATAQLIESFDADAIERATAGDKLTFRVELGEAGHEEWAHTFAVKTLVSEKLVSAYSNTVTLVQRIAPPPPTDFQLTAEASGIRLTWAEPSESEDRPTSFRVYRRPVQNRLYGQSLTRLAGDATEYLDRTAAFGERYIYAVTAAGHESPLLESFFGGEREIDYSDRFAPNPPTNLIALAESGRVRLLWDASTEEDVVGYVVFRRRDGTEFQKLTDEPVVDVEYSDRTVETGATYDYRVSAVDRVGNQGEPSASVVARIP